MQRLTAERIAQVMDVALAPVRMALAILPDMLRRGAGQLVFVSSLGGRAPILNEAAYNEEGLIR